MRPVIGKTNWFNIYEARGDAGGRQGGWWGGTTVNEGSQEAHTIAFHQTSGYQSRMTDPDPATEPRSIFIIYMQLHESVWSIWEFAEKGNGNENGDKDVAGDDDDCGRIHLIVHLIKLIKTGTWQQVNLSKLNKLNSLVKNQWSVFHFPFYILHFTFSTFHFKHLTVTFYCFAFCFSHFSFSLSQSQVHQVFHLKAINIFSTS